MYTRSDLYLVKLGINHLLSFSISDRTFFLQQLDSDYDLGRAIKLFVDPGSQGLRFTTLELESTTSSTLEIPDRVLQQINVSLVDHKIHADTPTSILRVAWYEGQDKSRNLNDFLHFFHKNCYLSYRGEYGNELMLFIPFIRFLVNSSLIESRKIVSYAGMKSHYLFIEAQRLITRPTAFRRTNVTENHLIILGRDPDNRASGSPYEFYTDLRIEIAEGVMNEVLPEPLFSQVERKVFILNKFCVEWGSGPINFLPLHVLDHLFRLFTKFDFEIIYYRPGIIESSGYAIDMDQYCNYPDLSIARKHNITVFQEAALDQDFNALKLSTFLMTDLFVATQGGASQCLPGFRRPIFLLHRQGPEFTLGFYGPDGQFSRFALGELDLRVFPNEMLLYSDVNSYLHSRH